MQGCENTKIVMLWRERLDIRQDQGGSVSTSELKQPELIFPTALFDLKSRNLIGSAAAGLERPDWNWTRRCLNDCAAMK